MHDATPSPSNSRAPASRSSAIGSPGGRPTASPESAGGGPAPSVPRPLRADALANRGRIVGTAREVFAAEGTGVSMAEIARRAGVGLATAFRHFATQEDLLTEVVADRVTACVATATAALEDPDAWRGFRTAVHRLCQLQCGERGLAPALVSSFLEADRFRPERAAFEAAFSTLIQRARRTGELSPGFGYADLVLLLKANAGVITLTAPDLVHAASRRLAAAVLRAVDAEADARPPG